MPERLRQVLLFRLNNKYADHKIKTRQNSEISYNSRKNLKFNICNWIKKLVKQSFPLDRNKSININFGPWTINLNIWKVCRSLKIKKNCPRIQCKRRLDQQPDQNINLVTLFYYKAAFYSSKSGGEGLYSLWPPWD